VDYEPGLAGFYRACGFRLTEAGLIHLGPGDDPAGLSPSDRSMPNANAPRGVMLSEVPVFSGMKRSISPPPCNST